MPKIPLKSVIDPWLEPMEIDDIRGTLEYIEVLTYDTDTAELVMSLSADELPDCDYRRVFIPLLSAAETGILEALIEHGSTCRFDAHLTGLYQVVEGGYNIIEGGDIDDVYRIVDE